jgi:transmembrane sensor
MSFHDTALGDVVAELNRYNVRKIRIANPALAAIRVGGEFRVTDVDAFLRLVQPTLPVHVVNHGDEILLQDSN